MADWSTISSIATAGGTLVLAIATFSSVKSGQRAARIAERSLLAAQRPLLLPSRPDDPTQGVRFVDDVALTAAGGGAAVKVHDDVVYMLMGVRNVGAGIAILESWQASPRALRGRTGHADPADFRRLTRDLYVPPGDVGFWQGALRDAADQSFEQLSEAIRGGEAVTLDLLYGDQEGGQRTITRFVLRLEDDGSYSASATRHWRLDGVDPRALEE